jgi:hypothetical protein
MKGLAALFWLAWIQATWAHHTKDHMMLSEEAQQVIAATREGGHSGWMWLAWAAVTGILLLGLVRWWYKGK